MLDWRDLVQSGGRITALQMKAPPPANSIEAYSSIRDTLRVGPSWTDSSIGFGAPHPRTGFRTQLYQSVLDAAVLGILGPKAVRRAFASSNRL
jgi:hypothetical protein